MRVLGLVIVLGVTVLAGAAAWLYTPDISLASLTAKYAVPPGDFVEVAGIRLHVRDSGKAGAPAVILLHGFGASLDTWDGWAAALSEQYRVVRFDLPGFALSGPDPTGDYGDERTMQVLAALMDHGGIAKASLVGNSLGGKIAWMFAARHPDRVETLVLVSPDGFASPGFDYGRRAQVPVLMRLLPYTLPMAMVRTTLAPAYGDPAVLTQARVARYRDMLLAPGIRRAMLARMAQVIVQPPEALLKSIRAPTLLVWGERDAMIPFGNAADYRQLIPDCRLAALPGLGHVPQEEAPQASVAPVLAFLAERTPAAP